MGLRNGFTAAWAAPVIMALACGLLAQVPRNSNPREILPRLGLYDIDPMTGTWDLKVAQSKFNPGPALKSAKVMTEIHGNSFKCVIDSVDSESKARHGEWSAKTDGKDYPAQMSPFADSIVLKKIDPDTIEAVYKRAGKPILNEKLAFSKDRKTLTMTQTGQGLNNVLLYARE